MVDKKKAPGTGLTPDPGKTRAGSSSTSGNVKPAGSSRFASALAGLVNIPKPHSPPPVIVQRKTAFTPEQEQFLSSNSPHLLLSALAGAGKTTCLFEYARRRPHQKWNFLVLNRNLVDVLARKAPPNVKVSTLHQIAFAAHGRTLSHKLSERPLPFEAMKKVLGTSLPEGLLPALRSGLDAFLSSDDPSPSPKHAPLAWTADPHWDPQQWTSSLEKLWAASLDPDNSLPISHSVYLKRYTQQESPWLADRWMLDEAQDWPDAVLSAFRRCARISIRAGDPCQRLYAFRGASMGQWHDPSHEKEFRLVQSHRASSDLEPYVNAALARLPGGWQWKGRTDMSCHILPRHQNETVEQIKEFNPSVILADRWKPLELLAQDLEGLLPCARKEKLSPGMVELSTIHGAKGREFSRVWLPDQAIATGLSPALTGRLLYVGLTRAQSAVSFPSRLVNVDHVANGIDLGAESLDFFSSYQ